MSNHANEISFGSFRLPLIFCSKQNYPPRSDPSMAKRPVGMLVSAAFQHWKEPKGHFCLIWPSVPMNPSPRTRITPSLQALQAGFCWRQPPQARASACSQQRGEQLLDCLLPHFLAVPADQGLKKRWKDPPHSNDILVTSWDLTPGWK